MDPILLISILVAAAVAFKLYQTLGTRTGNERPTQELDLAPARARAPQADVAPDHKSAEPQKLLSPVSKQAEPLRAADPSFDEREFLAGAKVAYEMIIEAFNAGDLKNVRRYLGQPVFNAFRQAATDREQLGHTSDIKFVGIDKAEIIRSEARDGAVSAVIEFVSDQIRVTRDTNGDAVAGDPSRIDRVVDRWTFSRVLASDDPNWVLVATGGSA